MHQIIVNGIAVDIIRKDIKNLHLAVYPPNGRVRVAAPIAVQDDAIRRAVINKLAWIKRQQKSFRDQDRQTQRQYISGESHYFQGNRYLLDVVETDAPPSVKIRNKKVMVLTIRPNTDRDKRERIMLDWYRHELKQQVAPLVDKWAKIIDVEVNDWRIKQMKTKWGSCNIEAQRIWLNLELAKKPVQCLEYIIVHEMVHLLERHHNARFTNFMNKFLPHWRTIRDELNSDLLAYETWDY